MFAKNELGTSCKTPSDANPERQREKRGDDYGSCRSQGIISLYEALDGFERRLVHEAQRAHARTSK